MPLQDQQLLAGEVSQRRILPDMPQVASDRPSGARRGSSSLSFSPRIVLRTARLAASRIVTRPVSSAAVMVPPSGANARAQRNSSFAGLQEPASLDVPEPHRLVVARRGESSPVRRKRERADAVSVAPEFPDAARRSDIPQADCPVLTPFTLAARPRWRASGRQERKRPTGPRPGGPGAYAAGVPIVDIPEPDVVSQREMPRREHSTIRRKCQRGHRPFPTVPAANELARGRIPELDRLGLVRVVASGREDPAIGRISRRPRLVLVADGRGRIRRRVEVPDLGERVPLAIKARPSLENTSTSATLSAREQAETSATLDMPNGNGLRPARCVKGVGRHPVSIRGEDWNVGGDSVAIELNGRDDACSACADVPDVYKAVPSTPQSTLPLELSTIRERWVPKL